jgi:integral membrane protein (TIGR00529 family)
MLNLLGVIIAFAVIILLIRKNYKLQVTKENRYYSIINFYKRYYFGLSLILGSIIVGVFSLQVITLIDIPKAFVQAIIYNFKTNTIETGTIELALLMTLIFMLAKCMQETGAIKKLIENLRSIFTKGGTLGIIPAVYGLMPVPGGALFSAPTIDEEGNKFKLDKNQKNFLNVWFRHIWFPIYPISSAMILITSVKFANFDISLIILANVPAFITSILIGYFYLKRFLKNAPVQKEIEKKDYSGLIYLTPPILPLFVYGFLQIFGISQIRSFLIGVISSIILVFYITDKTKIEYIQILKRSITFNLALAIFGIMIFREIFQVSQANIVLRDLILESNVPIIAMVVIIPLVLGVLTGYNLGAVALSYPILAPFFPTDINFITLVGFSSLIFISSLVGYLISPIHLCNVVSSDYLKTDTTRMYRMYIPAAIVMLSIQVIVIAFIVYLSGL